MPQIEAGKTIEEFYWERIREMSPAEKVRRAARMTAGVRAMVEYQIRGKNPEIDNNALKFAVARRRYWDEPKTLTMLDEAEEKTKRKIQGNDPALVDLDTTTARVVTLLDELQRPFAFTGGLAAITYGDMRTTNGVDLVLEINPWETDFAKILAEKFDTEFFFSLEGCREAIEEQTMFQAIDKETMFKVDFHLSDLVPGSCERRHNVRILTGRIVPMVIPEDSILSKLVWIKLGSDRFRKDVIAMLRVQTNLDNGYLETTAEKLGVTEILNDLRKIADSYDPNIVL